jgi:hypothetical protein
MNKDFESTPSSFNIKIDTADFRIKAERLVSEIIQEAFNNNHEKSKVIFRGERLNFACPYCGDSVKDQHKKRGNIYVNTWDFHCYNCRTHVGFEDFLKDFGKSIDGKEIVHVRSLREMGKTLSQETRFVDTSLFFDDQVLEKYALDKSLIFDKYNLLEIKSYACNWIRKYLSERHQYNFDTFAWDPKYNRLFIFNLTKQNKVLGFQVRNFKSEPKYVTHTIEMIYRHLEMPFENTVESAEVNRLSFLFGMNTTDFSRPIIVTEGPLDSFLIPNGMSVCGIDNDFPLEIGNIRWMYDYDEPGLRKTVEKMMRAEYVFLWRKFIKDTGIEVFSKKVDYTDIVKFAKKQRRNLLPLDDYFSNSKYDANYI